MTISTFKRIFLVIKLSFWAKTLSGDSLSYSAHISSQTTVEQLQYFTDSTMKTIIKCFQGSQPRLNLNNRFNIIMQMCSFKIIPQHADICKNITSKKNCNLFSTFSPISRILSIESKRNGTCFSSIKSGSFFLGNIYRYLIFIISF